MIRLPEEKRDYAEGGEWHDAFEDFYPAQSRFAAQAP
jgi:hypothetical protein